MDDNEQLMASLAQGLADSAAGHVHDAGDFTQYADDPFVEAADSNPERRGNGCQIYRQAGE